MNNLLTWAKPLKQWVNGYPSCMKPIAIPELNKEKI